MIQRFLQYLQYEKNFSSHTVSAYHTDLKQFCCFLNVDVVAFPYEDVTALSIQQWIIELIKNNISATSISRKISSLKSFWNFLQTKGLTGHNPTSKLILPKTSRPLPVFYKSKDMELVLRSFCSVENFIEIRDLLIINILYEAGLRVSELVSLKDENFDLAVGQLKVLGKGNKERIVPIGKSLIKKIEKYIVCRNQDTERLNECFFVRSNGMPMYRKAIYNIVHSKMSGVSTLHKQSPHVLRHTFATTLLNNGADINAVKDLMGHRSLAATQVYTHVSFNELNKIYKQAHPRAIKKGGGI